MNKETARNKTDNERTCSREKEITDEEISEQGNKEGTMLVQLQSNQHHYVQVAHARLMTTFYKT